MAISTETDIKELIAKIDKFDEKLTSKIDKLDEKLTRKIDRVDEKVDDLKVSVARLEENYKGLSGQIDDLKTKVTTLEGRVNTQLNWFLGVFVVLTGGLLGGLITVLSKIGFSGNPSS